MQLQPHHDELKKQRSRLLEQIASVLDWPMTLLAFAWLGLLIIDFTRGLTRPLEILNTVIWVLFGLHFALEFSIAPDKWHYLRHQWLTALALVLPAFRIFRVARAFRALRLARAARSVGLLRLITSINRGIGATRRLLSRRGVGYIAALTCLITFAGAAGMYAFENPSALREAGYEEVARDGGGLSNYGEALWWTAMIMTTMGTDYWPHTPEGRILCGGLALYAFAFFGYITATIASYFVVQDRQSDSNDSVRTDGPDLRRLNHEIEALRSQVGALVAELKRAHG